MPAEAVWKTKFWLLQLGALARPAIYGIRTKVSHASLGTSLGAILFIKSSSSKSIWTFNSSISKHYTLFFLSKPAATHRYVLLAHCNKLANPALPSLLLFHSPCVLRKKLSNPGEVGY